MVTQYRRIVPGMLLAVALSGASAPAQTMSSGKGKERTSRAGQLQTGAKSADRASGPRMYPETTPVAEPINGKITDMETALAQQPRGDKPAGEVQPRVEEHTASAPEGGKGEQQASPQPRTTAAKHLRILLRVTKGGGVEVVTSTEIPGEAVPAESPIGDYLVQVQKNDQTVAVQALADPFQMRSYPPRDEPERGHHVEEAREALISVDVPDTTLASPDLETTAVRVYRIKRGTTVDKIDKATFMRLERAGRLEKTLDTSGTPVGRQIREKGIKLAE